MAHSRYQTTQFSAEKFVESAGVVLFHVSTRQICLIHHSKRNEWLLPKGRRNLAEHRSDTAIREAQEETGQPCRLLPVTMKSRTPPAIEIGHYPDEPRLYEQAYEPFMVTCRTLEDGDMKFMSWFIAAINENETLVDSQREENFTTRLFGLDEAVKTITFQSDREIIQEAIRLFTDSYN